MTATATAGRLLTAEEFQVLPIEGPADLVEGVIVAMGPAGFQHGGAVVRCAALLQAAADAAGGRCAVVAGDTGFVLGRAPDVVRGADVAVVRRDRLPASPVTRFFEGAPDLVVEVRSPFDRPRACEAKVADYLAAGTAVVWDVDPAARTVTIHRPTTPPRVLRATDALDAAPVLPGLTAPVSTLFDA